MPNKLNKALNFLINVTKNIISSFFVDILFSFTINRVDHSHISKNHDKFNDLHILRSKHFEGENKKEIKELAIQRARANHVLKTTPNAQSDHEGKRSTFGLGVRLRKID